MRTTLTTAAAVAILNAAHNSILTSIKQIEPNVFVYSLNTDPKPRKAFILNNIVTPIFDN